MSNILVLCMIIVGLGVVIGGRGGVKVGLCNPATLLNREGAPQCSVDMQGDDGSMAMDL